MEYEQILDMLPVKYEWGSKKQETLLDYLVERFDSPEELLKTLRDFPCLTTRFNELYRNYILLLEQTNTKVKDQGTPISDEVRFRGVTDFLFKEFTHRSPVENHKAYGLMLSLLKRRDCQRKRAPEKTPEQLEAIEYLRSDEPYAA